MNKLVEELNAVGGRTMLSRAPKGSNRAPVCQWFVEELPGVRARALLYVDGRQTSFFIDTALSHAHRSSGEKHGLFGAGMGRRSDAGYRIAAQLACGDRITPLKHRAEQMAMADL